jgi:hypothetical protein
MIPTLPVINLADFRRPIGYATFADGVDREVFNMSGESWQLLAHLEQSKDQLEDIFRVVADCIPSALPEQIRALAPEQMTAIVVAARGRIDDVMKFAEVPPTGTTTKRPRRSRSSRTGQSSPRTKSDPS